MGIARRKLGMSPELFDPDKAISTSGMRVDFVLEEDNKEKKKVDEEGEDDEEDDKTESDVEEG